MRRMWVIYNITYDSYFCGQPSYMNSSEHQWSNKRKPHVFTSNPNKWIPEYLERYTLIKELITEDVRLT